LAILLLCGAVFLAYPWRARLQVGEWTFPLDDPWIHQVYARNLARFHCYAFNPCEPGTGSSAPLWTLLMVPPHLFGWDPVVWALVLGLLSLAGLGWVVWRWGEERFPSPIPAVLTAALLLSPQVSWAGTEGMETALAACLATFILWRLGRQWTRWTDAFLEGALLGALLWLRPEAPLLALVSLWQRRREKPLRLAGWLVALSVLTAPYVAFHLRTGGRVLPQTVYAKAAYYARPISLQSLGSFLHGLALSFGPGIWPLAVLLLALGVISMVRARERVWGPALLWSALTLLVAAWRMPVVLHFGRHFVPVVPALLLVSGEGWRMLPKRMRWAVGAAAAILAFEGLVIGSALYSGGCQMLAEGQLAMGRYIRAQVPLGEPIATHDVGAIGYFGEHPVVDTMALVTPELTPVLALHDDQALWGYLQQRNVHYLAALEGLHPAICAMPGVQEIVRYGRMSLYRLP